jgi:hypothetical protein
MVTGEGSLPETPLPWAQTKTFWTVTLSGALPNSPVFLIKGALFTLTEPHLGLLRRLLPVARIGAVGLDLSALVGHNICADPSLSRQFPVQCLLLPRSITGQSSYYA